MLAFRGIQTISSRSEFAKWVVPKIAATGRWQKKPFGGRIAMIAALSLVLGGGLHWALQKTRLMVYSA